MNKEEKKLKKEEKKLKFMPKWVRTLLILGGLLLSALSIVFAIKLMKGVNEALLSEPNFVKLDSSGYKIFIVLIFIIVVVGFLLVLSHFLLPKLFSKKKISVKNSIFSIIIFLVSLWGLIIALTCIDPLTNYVITENYQFYSYQGKDQYIVKASTVSEYLKDKYSANDELINFLDDNKSLVAIASGYAMNSDEDYIKNFDAHPHKAYTGINSISSQERIIDFYLGDIDLGALEAALETYSMPSKQYGFNQDIWVTYGSSDSNTVNFMHYSNITPNFTKVGSFANGHCDCYIDYANHAMRLIFMPVS